MLPAMMANTATLAYCKCTVRMQLRKHAKPLSVIHQSSVRHPFIDCGVIAALQLRSESTQP